MRTCSPFFNLKKRACIIMSIGLISSCPNLFSLWSGSYSDCSVIFYTERKRSKKRLQIASAFCCKRLFTLFYYIPTQTIGNPYGTLFRGSFLSRASDSRLFRKRWQGAPLLSYFSKCIVPPKELPAPSNVKTVKGFSEMRQPPDWIPPGSYLR